jgi:hypothetical protein
MRQQNYSRQPQNHAREIKQTQVPLGISLVFYSLVLKTLLFIILFLVPFTRNLSLIVFVLFSFLILATIASIMAIVGKVLCFTAPKRMPGKGVIYVSIGFDLLSISLSVLERFIDLPKAITDLNGTITAIAFITFLIFLKQVAEYINKPNLGKEAEQILLVGIGLIVSSILAVFLPSILGLIFLILVVALFLVGLIRYYKLLSDLSNALQLL